MSVEAPARPETMRTPLVLPLSEVPMERGVSTELVHVAGHELNHALAAIGVGIPIVGISVIPEDNSLGRTMLAGYASPQAMQIVAAAGSVHTHDGTARGFGSDLYKAAIIGAHFGSSAVDFAQDAAARIIAGYSKEVREKAAEIIAYKKEVTGGMIFSILERARLEVMLEREGGKQLFVIEEPSEDTQLVDLNQGEYTVIDDLGKAGSRIRYIVDGRVQEEHMICPSCQGIDGHFGGCVMSDVTQTSESTDDQEKKTPSDALSQNDEPIKERVHRRSGSGRGRCRCHDKDTRVSCPRHTKSIDKNLPMAFPTFPKSGTIFKKITP